jgi:thiamine pyrophosphokinase
MSRRIDTAVVFAAGVGNSSNVTIPSGALVIAADGGADRALELGITVDLIIGDLDSVGADALGILQHAAVGIERHPRDKDATDLALAFDKAQELGARRILLVGPAGGRLDHLLGELLLLGSETYAEIEIDASLGTAAIHVVRSQRTLSGTPGELVSLFALHGPAEGVEAQGLLYPLRGEALEPGSSRGISNAFAEDEARISVERGVVLVVRPGGEA